MNFVYSASEVNINFAVPIVVPGILEQDFSIQNFISVAIVFTKPKFFLTEGVFTEKVINYSPSDIVGINIAIQHGSSDIEQLDLLYKAQEIGVIGLPLSIRTTSKQEDTKKRRSYIAPVAILTKQPSERYTEKGDALVYNFETPYIQTILI